MNRILLISFLVAPLAGFSQTGKPNFLIQGELKNFSEQAHMIYMYYATAGGDRITDSAEVKDGAYQFRGTLPEPVKAQFRIRYRGAKDMSASRKNMFNAFIDNTRMHFVSIDSFSNVRITGSRSNTDFQLLTRRLEKYEEQQRALNQRYMELFRRRDEAGIKQLRAEAEKIEKAIHEVYRNFAREKPTSGVALYALTQYAGYAPDVAKVAPIFNKLSSGVKTSPSGKLFAQQLEMAKKTAIGQPAADFTQPDTAGQPVSLSSFRGRYVLLDFWASWCVPCRDENPRIVKAFHKYATRGFTVLSVSLDRPESREKWIDAIRSDNLTWTHVSDLRYWDNSAAKLYGVQAIPQNFLIDPDGIIIGRNLTGDALFEKLASIFETAP